MRNFRDVCYDIYRHNNINLKFPDFSVAFIDISKTQKSINRKGSAAYNVLFSDWEKSHISSIAVPKRLIDFISGRLAAKKAVRKQFIQNGHYDSDKKKAIPYFKDIEIKRTVTGKPVVFIKDGKSERGSSEYHISVSHTRGIAAAFAVIKYGCKGIGIDIEKIEDRQNSFLEIVFTKNEIIKLKYEPKGNGDNKDLDKYNEEITTYWTIKEAVMKCMGVGVNIDLKDIEVAEAKLHTARVDLKYEAAKRFNLLEGNEIQVWHARIEGFIVSLACLF